MLQDVFEEGERVRCLIINVDQESQRISLSTADLEETTGDMLMDKVRFCNDWQQLTALSALLGLCAVFAQHTECRCALLLIYSGLQ